MKKFSLPVLAVLFSLFFSGRPPGTSDIRMVCQGNALFYNFTSIPVTKIEITDLTWGGTTTYNNPAFPVSYSNLNSNFTITEYFDTAHSGNIQVTNTSSTVLSCTRFDNTSSVSFNYHLDCNINIIKLVNGDAPVDCN